MHTDALNPSAVPADKPRSTLLMSIDEVAQECETSPDTVYRWLRNGKDFPRPIELPSRGLRWKRDRVLAWIDAEDERANAHTA